MNAQEKFYNPLGLYVHVPFCAIPCDYCAFYKVRPTRELMDRYVSALLKEIDAIEDNRAFDTIYFGGGTPGILPPPMIDTITDAIHKKLKKDPIEWTIELAPNTVSAEKLRHWKQAGVNRISMGVQSFQEKTLKALGRRQIPVQIFRAYDEIRNAGFTNIGLDLIFSAPGQTIQQLQADLEQAMQLQPEHISTYCLTYEGKTPLTEQYGDGANEEQDSDFYEYICDNLSKQGYQQYEISNFAKPGYESQHNLHTWQMAEWIGVGPAASSQYRGKRYTNIASLARWVEGIEKKQPQQTDTIFLNEKILAVDRLIFGLRMNTGVDLANHPYRETIVNYVKLPQVRDFFILQEDNLKLTDRGRLLCDALSRELFNLLD